MPNKYMCPMKTDEIILCREVSWTNCGACDREAINSAEKIYLKRHSMCLERDIQTVLLNQASWNYYFWKYLARSPDM